MVLHKINIIYNQVEGKGSSKCNVMNFYSVNMMYIKEIKIYIIHRDTLNNIQIKKKKNRSKSDL